MNDLLYYFQTLDILKPHHAIQKFYKSIYIKDNEVFLIIGKHKDCKIFSFEQSKFSWHIDSNICFNCLPIYYEILRQNKCRKCGKLTNPKFPNYTGVPRDINVPSLFYIYNDSKLFIYQSLTNETVLNVFEERKDLDEWNELIWKRYGYIILPLASSGLVIDIRQYIIRFLMELKVFRK